MHVATTFGGDAREDAGSSEVGSGVCRTSAVTPSDNVGGSALDALRARKRQLNHDSCRTHQQLKRARETLSRRTAAAPATTAAAEPEAVTLHTHDLTVGAGYEQIYPSRIW